MNDVFQRDWAAGYLNGKMLFNTTVMYGTQKSHGFVGVGTSSWGMADFDDVKVAGPKEARVYMNVQ